VNAGDAALWLAFAAAAVAVVAQAARLSVRPDGPASDAAPGRAGAASSRASVAWSRAGDAWSRRAMTLAAATAALLFVWLVTRFLALDLGIEYVFLYTARDVPWQYRIAGAWTGREGSLLLWATLIAAVAAAVAWRDARRAPRDADRSRNDAAGVAGDSETRERMWMRLVLFVLAAAFLYAVARQGTFSATDPFFLQGRPGGNGINPTLRSPYILIHPPLVFVAYALAAIPFAAVFAHLIHGGGHWSRTGATGARAGWLVFTVAMGLGGLWAYYTLGFGGYWAWDPVEVANFLPWLAMTVYLHAQLRHGRDGGLASAGPLLGMLPFLLTVFSTVSTRSGLWVSVHAFTDPTNAFQPDAATRLLDILDVDASLLPYASILVASFALGLALWTRWLAVHHGCLARTSRVVAGVLAAVAVAAVLAPAALVAAWFELGHFVAAGHTGFGALGLLIGAILLAAAPALAASDTTADAGDATTGAAGDTTDGAARDATAETRTDKTRPRRTGAFTGLLYASTLALSFALVIAILFHFAAVNGWNRAFWEDRVPWLATPIALLLIWFLQRPQRGARGATVVAVGGLAVAVGAFVATGRLGAYAVALATVVLASAVHRFAVVAFSGPATARVGSTLLWLAALLDLVFWLSPPTVLPGVWGWQPAWPWHVPMGLLAATALVGAHRVGVGAHRAAAGRTGDARAWWPYALAAALGGYFVAPLLAVAAYILHRRAAPKPRRWTGASVRSVGVYGVHFAVGLLFVGYAVSTYYDATANAELARGGSAPLGDMTVVFTVADAEAERGTPWTDRVVPRFAVRDGGIGGGTDAGTRDGSAVFYWEATTGSHYPLPGTVRTWQGDVYVSITGVCTAPCGDWTAAYEQSPRLNWAEPVEGVRVQLVWLPAVGLVWTSLALFAGYGALLVRPTAPATARATRAARASARSL
jgi:cytochrome c-type biogenesis protein CcmF